MLEAVPNVSEGRDPAVIDAIGAAFATSAALLDVHTDADHHRSVFTLVGEEEPLLDSLLAGIATTVELVDLREHLGVHPRVGAADVVPLVPLSGDAMESPSRRHARWRPGSETSSEYPSSSTGRWASARRPAFFRRGARRPPPARRGGELAPDAGPLELDPRSGAVLVGARDVLVAYNLELATDDVEVASAVARVVRESSGGMQGVQAIGLHLPESGRIQVSMNVIDVEQAPLHELVERVRAEAAARGVEVAGGGLVGLVPERVLRTAGPQGVELPGVDEAHVLERALDRH